VYSRDSIRCSRGAHVHQTLQIQNGHYLGSCCSRSWLVWHSDICSHGPYGYSERLHRQQHTAGWHIWNYSACCSWIGAKKGSSGVQGVVPVKNGMFYKTALFVDHRKGSYYNSYSNQIDAPQAGTTTTPAQTEQSKVGSSDTKR
jgi:hypothetical protein